MVRRWSCAGLLVLVAAALLPGSATAQESPVDDPACRQLGSVLVRCEWTTPGEYRIVAPAGADEVDLQVFGAGGGGTTGNGSGTAGGVGGEVSARGVVASGHGLVVRVGAPGGQRAGGRGYGDGGDGGVGTALQRGGGGGGASSVEFGQGPSGTSRGTLVAGGGGGAGPRGAARSEGPREPGRNGASAAANDPSGGGGGGLRGGTAGTSGGGGVAGSSGVTPGSTLERVDTDTGRRGTGRVVATFRLDLNQPADLAVTIAAPASFRVDGGFQTVTLRVTNRGPGLAQGATVYVVDRAGRLTNVGTSGGSVGPVERGRTVERRVSFRALRAGEADLLAQVWSPTPDGSRENNRATATVPVLPAR